MIVVTGATGNVGRTLVPALIAAGERVTTVARGASVLAMPGGVQASLNEPESLKPAFAGAEALFLLTSGDWVSAGGDGSVILDVLDVARAGGVRRVVLLSSQGVGSGRHASELEDAVKESGLEWTMLRPGGFNSNAFLWAESVRAQRVVAAPFGDVGLPIVDPVDIAAMAVVSLLETGHGGHTYTLTGPELISPRQQAAAIADVLGEPVRFVEQTKEQAWAQMTQFMPERVVDATLAILGAPSALEQQVSSDVERVLGRRPHGFAEWAERNIAAFR
jgi:uncharacterized protein YbjT (DUF2867 family)